VPASKYKSIFIAFCHEYNCHLAVIQVTHTCTGLLLLNILY
jgi:hypothetical protein